MKLKSVCVVVGVVIMMAAGVRPVAAVEPEVTVVRLSDRVVILNVPSSQSTNVVALRTQMGVVVVDTEASPVLAERIRQRIEAEFEGSPISFVINTHAHGDHSYGNQAFADAVIVAHASVASAMEAAEGQRQATVARLEQVVTQLATRLESLPSDSEAVPALQQRISHYESMRRGLGEGFRLTVPTVGFADELHLDLGDLSLELSWFGKAHSDSDILVRCPEERLLMTGDLFAPGLEPYVDSERIGHFSRWIAKLEEIRNSSSSVTTVIPGHGGTFAPSALEPILDFVQAQAAAYAGRESAFFEMRRTVATGGLDAGLSRLRQTADDPEHFYLIHSEIDSFAFHMMMDGQVDEALRIFELLAELFPENDVAFDSLGEAHLRRGDRDLAASAFRRALELNPENGNAAARLTQMEQT